jgi:hypothetical protein
MGKEYAKFTSIMLDPVQIVSRQNHKNLLFKCFLMFLDENNFLLLCRKQRKNMNRMLKLNFLDK